MYLKSSAVTGCNLVGSSEGLASRQNVRTDITIAWHIQLFNTNSANLTNKDEKIRTLPSHDTLQLIWEMSQVLKINKWAIRKQSDTKYFTWGHKFVFHIIVDSPSLVTLSRQSFHYFRRGKAILNIYNLSQFQNSSKLWL